MYLKALEIQGFKSFPDKTVLNFDADITAIVGPNGSGKSNISDAIRWVMGEQSSRNLRGAKMEDVIFGGTEKRPAVGFAQVTLVLDNSEHIFPQIDSSEVMVTRRYYRSGESEYYVNKQSVRLRDVNELFMDTGLGKEGYSIIGQGQIAEILSLKSTDRREIFEEAAGISKFRHRKDEAERKLQRTEENLLRINDKAAELELQVGPLREQAEKAKRFLILRDELRVLEISVWLENIETLKAAARKLQTELSAAQEEHARAKEALETLYQRSEQFSQRTRDNDLRQEEVRRRSAELGGQISEQESAVAVLRTKLGHHEESIARLREELSDQDSRREGLQAQMDQQERRLREIRQSSEQLETELQSLLQKAQEAAASAGSAAAEAESLRGREALSAAAAADSRSELSALRSALEQMAERRSAIAGEAAGVEETIESKRAEAKRCRRALEEAEDEAAAAANVIAGHRMRMEGRRQRVKTAEDRKLQLTMDHKAMTDRIALLEEMEKEYEGFHKAVRMVMQAAEKNTLRGVRGPVASLIQVEDRCSVAIEIALGAGMQNIVVDREEHAKSAIQYLKQRDGGRATFLPLTAIRGEVLRERGVEEELGFVGIASELVRYDQTYEGIFHNLLGRTVVVEDLDCGIAMARKYQNRFRIVTLDGQVINRGGAMTGGSVSRSAGILTRSNELDRLKGQLSGMADRLQEAVREAEEAQRDLTAAAYEMEVAEAQQRAAEDTVLKLQGEKGQYDMVLDALRTNAENLQAESEALQGRIADAEDRAERCGEDIRRREAEAEQYRAEAEAKRSGGAGLQELTATIGEQVSACKSEIAALQAEGEATKRAVADLQTLSGQMLGDRADREALIRQYQTEGEALSAEIAERTAAAEALREQEALCREEIERLGTEKLGIEAERTASDRELKECNDNLLNMEREVARLEQKKATTAMEENQILDKLWEHYELSHSAALEQRIEIESVPKANRRIGELKREISGLGTVNVGAIEDFERVNTRYTYLTEQRDDVEKAKGELVGVIEDIIKEMTGIFAAQFALINECFQTTFTELFGGGKATLELEDPEDILNCGIEIRVQPPGKALKTITLLSGGEKAFVAIALYFAILKVHPTPFVVMDEIEAALDEPNVVRYAQYMRAITGRTQFIVITHRRGTMEEADVLYGVTMQEKGVSKVLTINMNDMAKELKLS